MDPVTRQTGFKSEDTNDPRIIGSNGKQQHTVTEAGIASNGENNYDDKEDFIMQSFGGKVERTFTNPEIIF